MKKKLKLYVSHKTNISCNTCASVTFCVLSFYHFIVKIDRDDRNRSSLLISSTSARDKKNKRDNLLLFFLFIHCVI